MTDTTNWRAASTESELENMKWRFVGKVTGWLPHRAWYHQSLYRTLRRAMAAVKESCWNMCALFNLLPVVNIFFF